MTLEDQAMAVLEKERLWMDFEGDDDDDDELRYSFIEAASDLVQRITGRKLQYNQASGLMEVVSA